LHQEPVTAYNSIEDLAGDATFIVDGLVDSSTIPSRRPDANLTNFLETDIVFLVNKVMKGDLGQQKTLPRVVVSQNGGSLEKLTVVPEEPLMV
jgi:hypothetical protein